MSSSLFFFFTVSSGSFAAFGRNFFAVIFLIFVFFLGLDGIPLFLLHDRVFQRALVIAAYVVTNQCLPPEVVNEARACNHIGVVQLVVVANPRAGKSPE